MNGIIIVKCYTQYSYNEIIDMLKLYLTGWSIDFINKKKQYNYVEIAFDGSYIMGLNLRQALKKFRP